MAQTASNNLAFWAMKKVIVEAGHAYGPPTPAGGPYPNDENVFYTDLPIKLVSESFADGGSVDIQSFTENSIQPGVTLYSVAVPPTAKPSDSVTFHIKGHDYTVNAAPNTVQAVAPAQPFLNARPMNSAVVGNPTNRQAPPSDRQLVAFENNPANPDFGRLMGIDPADAKGIGLPAFTVGNGVPLVGTVKGEGYYDVATGMGYVWDNAAWQPVTPRAEIEEWEATKPYVVHEVVEWKGVLWLATQGVPINNEPVSPSAYWRPISTTGLVPVPTACDPAAGLSSIPKLNGAHAIDLSNGQIYTLVDNGGGDKVWVEMYGAVVEESISSNTPAGDVIGELKMFAANVTLPNGWVVADGSPIDASKPLAIGVLGPNLPDLTDQFIRGGTAAQAGQTAGYTTALPQAGWTIPDHDHGNVLPQGTNVYQHFQRTGGTLPTEWGDFSGRTSMASLQVSGGDAETAPQHFRVIFAVYIG